MKSSFAILLCLIVSCSVPMANEPASMKAAAALEVRSVTIDEGRVARGVIYNPTDESQGTSYRFRYFNGKGEVLSSGAPRFSSVRVEAGKEVVVQETCALNDAIRAELLLGLR